MLPSKKEYTWPLSNTSEGLEKMNARIATMNALEAQDALIKYAWEDFMPVNEKTNMLEMMALYQKALTILGKNLKVDGFFGAKTRKVLQEFQKENGLVADGIPGERTTAKILSKLSEKIPTNNPAREVLESLKITEQDNQRVTEILREVWKSSLYDARNINANYSGKDWRNIDYAYIRQSDGEYYIYDKPSEVTPVKRTVYRTDENFKVIGVAMIDWTGKILSIRGKPFTALYMPTPLFTAKATPKK